MSPTSLSNVGQVSVLKGPQGTLFGRNSTAGIIQMTTRDPSAHFGGEVSTEIDNYLTSRNFAYLTGGLTPELKANIRSEERRDGKECVSTCRSRGSPSHTKTKKKQQREYD